MVSKEEDLETSYPHGGWMAEKTRRILEQLAYFIDELNRPGELGDISEEARDEIRSRIGTLLHDATKVFAASHHADWGPYDRDLIMERGYDGYKELTVRYGLWTPPAPLPEPERWSIAAFVADARALIGGTRAQSRTQLHELLLKASLVNAYVEQFAQALEHVTQGELDWEDFQAQGALILRQLEKKASR